MFKRIHIKNFRSCKDLVLDDLGAMSALIGHNGSGKTSILRAIEWMARNAVSADIVDSIALYSRPEFTVDFEHKGLLYRYHQAPPIEFKPLAKRFQESLQVKVGNKWSEVFNRQGQNVKLCGLPERIVLSPVVPTLPSLASLLPENQEIRRHVIPLLSFLRTVGYYPMDEPNDVKGIDAAAPFISAEQYRLWLNQPRTSEARSSVLMRLLHAYLDKRSQFDEIHSLLGPAGLGLFDRIDVDHGEHPLPRDFHLVVFKLGASLGGGDTIDLFSQLSLGTRRVVRLIVSLVMDGSSLMLIEHPEDGIHRGLVRKLTHLLQINADPTQIILSSHSSMVLDQLAAKDMRLISIENGSTKVHALTAKELSSAARFMDEEGTMAEFLETMEA